MKRFVFFVVCALMLAGCATQNVDKEKDNQSTTSKKVYDGNNQKEQAISERNCLKGIYSYER